MAYLKRMLRPRSMGLGLALITLLVYLPAAGFRFINFDDPTYVTENPIVSQGLSWFGIKWAFVGAHASNWHPLTWISHMVDCDIFRLNPAGHHLVNVLLHALNAALLFTLWFRCTQKLWASVLISALFAWHPLHVESVAWVAERKDVLSTFFSLLTLLAYVCYGQARTIADKDHVLSDVPRPNPPPRSPATYYVWAIFFFALALLSKPMPVTLPAVMLLLDFWPLARNRGATFEGKKLAWLLLEKIPFGLLSLAVCLITLLAQHHAESSLANIPAGLRLENAVTATVGYLGKMIWPLQLAAFYPFPKAIAPGWFIQAVLLLLGFSALAWRLRRSCPWLIVGWLWFGISLLPVIGLVQVGGQAMADRYTYFPLIGIFVAIGFWLQNWMDQFPAAKKWLAAALIFVLGSCVFLTERQLAYWHDSETLFSHTLSLEQSDIAHVCLGSALEEQGRKAEALNQFIQAWRIQPASLLANVNIAGIMVEEGRYELAAKYYELALEHNAWLPNANENYGRVLVTLKRYAEAEKQFQIAAEIDPFQAQPHYLLGQLYLQQGKTVTAAKEFRECLRLEPGNLEITVLLASILAGSENAQARNGAEAQVLATQAVEWTNHQQPAALDVLAMSYAENGKFDQAIQTEQAAIKLAEVAGRKDDLLLLRKRLAVYEKYQPWREPGKAPE